jgi:hypothetical protein
VMAAGLVLVDLIKYPSFGRFTVLKRVDWRGHQWRLSLREMLF